MPLRRTTIAAAPRPAAPTGRPPTPTAGRLVPGAAVTACVLALAAGCGGAPPQPLPTAPPPVTPSLGSLPPGHPSGPPPGILPSGAVPTLPGLPPGGLPTYPLPTNPLPAYPTPTRALPTGTTRPTTTRPTTPPPSPAPRCAGGPTAAQVLAVLTGSPGVPTGAELKVTRGPFCARSWQFSTVVLKAEPDSEPLQVVTTGRPTALTLVEAGADVCSDRVQTQAPPGIRVLACGS